MYDPVFLLPLPNALLTLITSKMCFPAGNAELRLASRVTVVTWSDPVVKRTRCCLKRRTSSGSVRTRFLGSGCGSWFSVGWLCDVMSVVGSVPGQFDDAEEDRWDPGGSWRTGSNWVFDDWVGCFRHSRAAGSGDDNGSMSLSPSRWSCLHVTSFTPARAHSFERVMVYFSSPVFTWTQLQTTDVFTSQCPSLHWVLF